MTAGSLTVVGTGIQFGSQITAEARIVLENADIVLYVVAGPGMRTFLESLNPNSHSLARLLRAGQAAAPRPTRR